MMTRSINRILKDMDDSEQALVQKFGHCSQELVNLMICGRAVTNVFDKEKKLDGGLSLYGIPFQTDIGYLTLLET
eukprot:UN19394